MAIRSGFETVSLLNMPRMLNKDLNSIHAESLLSTVKPHIQEPGFLNLALTGSCINGT